MRTHLCLFIVAACASTVSPSSSHAGKLADAAGAVKQIIAHRGASSERPECTLSAIRRAIEVGATAVEMDVRTSKDGVLFLLHDATLDRTTNGSGPAVELTIADLKRLDAGTWFDPAYKDERIPTMREALEICKGKVDVLLDLKEQGSGYDEAVAAEVRRFGDPARTIVGVRSVDQAKRIRKLLPKARQLGLIPNTDAIEAFADAGADTIRLWPKWLNQDAEDLVERVRQAKAALHLNGQTGTLEETLPLLQFSPDSLSSDNPARLLATLASLADGEADSSDPAKVVFKEDVVYGRVYGAGLLADVAYPESKKPLPAIISVHGGRWRAGHRRDGSAIKVQQWAGFGFFAISIDYRLVSCTPAPACYQDLQCAIRYVHANAKALNVDTDRIFLIGQSAGGHMVSLAATLGDGPFPRTGGWQDASNDIRAAISVAANYELTTLSWGNIWTPAKGDPIAARKLASPVNHVKKGIKPLLILHSDNDRSVPIENALLMVEALKKAEAPFNFHRYEKMGHMGINEEVIKRSLEFIKEQSAKQVQSK